MSSIDPVIRNYTIRKVLYEHAQRIGVEPGQYSWNTLSMKVRFDDGEKSETQAVNALLARSNMERENSKGKPSGDKPMHRPL